MTVAKAAAGGRGRGSGGPREGTRRPPATQGRGNSRTDRNGIIWKKLLTQKKSQKGSEAQELKGLDCEPDSGNTVVLVPVCQVPVQRITWSYRG